MMRLSVASSTVSQSSFVPRKLLARGRAADAVAGRALFEEVEASELVTVAELLCLAFLAACSVFLDTRLAERAFEVRKRDHDGAVEQACCIALLNAHSECGLHDRLSQVDAQDMRTRRQPARFRGGAL